MYKLLLLTPGTSLSHTSTHTHTHPFVAFTLWTVHLLSPTLAPSTSHLALFFLVTFICCYFFSTIYTRKNWYQFTWLYFYLPVSIALRGHRNVDSDFVLIFKICLTGPVLYETINLKTDTTLTLLNAIEHSATGAVQITPVNEFICEICIQSL